MPAWLLAFLSHWGTKTVGILLVIALVGGGLFLFHRNGYNTGYRVGYAQSLKDNPPNVYNGATTVNQQPCPAPSIFGIDLGKWGFGIIHKR